MARHRSNLFYVDLWFFECENVEVSVQSVKPGCRCPSVRVYSVYIVFSNILG